jgi:glycosyltransferase involved in cell wall biosynthesis
MEKLHWSVDSLLLRDNAILGSGWIFHEDVEIQSLHLRMRLNDSPTVNTILADFGKSRPDVAQTFSEYATACNSGYALYATCTQAVFCVDDVTLLVTLVDGREFKLAIPSLSLPWISHRQKASERRLAIRQAIVFLKRALELTKAGRFSIFSEKVARYIRGKPRSSISEEKDILPRLKSVDREHVVLVIDHNLGGGANHYRERLVADFVEAGTTVLVFSYHVASLSYMLMMRNKRVNERYAIPGSHFLAKIARHVAIREIIYNSGVSFSRPEEIPQLIIALKAQNRARVTILVHDFFIVCPSHFLLDAQGLFCRLPEIRKCQECLLDNKQGFVALFSPRDINLWRALWSRAINAADEIRTFSRNSLELLVKAYPHMDTSRTVVKPHTVSYLPSDRVSPSYTKTLRIGAVGKIGYHKGAKFVQELSKEIKRRNADIKIVIIGSIEAMCDVTVVRQMGPYQHGELADLIRRSGANVMLFPSIWPETFSYVVQELIELDLPIACFDIGAPSERLAEYEKGLVLRDRDPSAVLDQLVSFHQRIYFSNRVSYETCTRVHERGI